MMQNRFTILKARGTAAGILSDIKTLTGDTSATITLDPERGWLADETYPDDDYCYADLDMVHVGLISFTNKSQRSLTEIQGIIRRYLVPLHIQIYYS